MKVKLLRTPFFNPSDDSHRIGTSCLPSLGMAQVVTYLKRRGFEVEQDDLNIKFHKSDFVKDINKHKSERFIIKKIARRLIDSTDLGHKLDSVLLSVYTSDFGINNLLVEEIATAVREKLDCKIIIGGRRFFFVESFFPLLKEKIVDFVIKGNPSLIEKVLFKNKTELKQIRGVAFEDKGEVFFKKPTSDNYLQEIPDFSGLSLNIYKWNPDKNFKHPFLKGINKKPNILVLPISFIRGCVYNCAFCSSSANKQRFYALEPKKVVNSLETLSEKYHTHFFLFLNNTLNFSKKYTQRLCEEIISRDLKIFWSDSVSTIGLDKKTLKLIKDAGCIRLYFGLETASQKLQSYINKNLSLSEFSNVLKYSSKIGIWNGVELIPGLPYETDEDVSQTVSFINKHKEYIDELTISPFYISRFSEFYNKPKKFGLRIKQRHIVSNPKKGYFYPMVLPFDEINGLKWPEKLRQIEESYYRIHSEIKIPSQFPDERFFFLCWLYNQGYNKGDIKEIYNIVYARTLRKKYFKLKNIIEYAFKIKSFKDITYNLSLFKKFINVPNFLQSGDLKS